MERDQAHTQSENKLTQFIENNLDTIAQAFIYVSTETLENAQEEERRAFLSRFSIAVATINRTLQWLNRATNDRTFSPTAEEQRETNRTHAEACGEVFQSLIDLIEAVDHSNINAAAAEILQ